MLRPPVLVALLPLVLLASGTSAAALNPGPLASPVKLVFVHHSCGESWLADENGGLGLALRGNGYFVSDTNYGWGPLDLDEGGGNIGDHTDIGHFWRWFSGPNRVGTLAALFAESGQHSSYSRLASDPGGPNRIVLFKSCFPNSHLGGSPSDPIPPIGSNPLRSEGSGSEHHTIANAKGIYNELLSTFATKTDTLFVLVTAPPLNPLETDGTAAANARALNDWLVRDWLKTYPHRNVAVLDFYNVLTSNGGSTRTNDPNVNDLGWSDGNHHRYRNGAIEHTRTVASHTAAYGSSADDSHPTAAGNLKATGELVPLLNIAYHCFAGDGGCPTSTAPPPGTVLVIDHQPGDGRFRVTLDWSTVQDGGRSGKAQAISTIPLGVTSGGLFWFFSASNPEALVKVLDGCTINGHFWAFASAGTNVGYTMTFTDTATGATQVYTNSDVHPAEPVQDTVAFPCP